MKVKKYPYSGYTISWNFYTMDSMYEDFFSTKEVNENVYNDLFEVLKILHDEKLFFPTKIILDKGSLELNTENLDEVIRKIRTVVESKMITAEIDQIQGKSILYNNGEEEIIDDLLTIDEFRFFERKFSICTSKSVWIPISIDLTYSYQWQTKLYESNAYRLEKALKKIYQSLGLKVEPSPEELSKESPIWQLGFRLFPNLEILEDEFRRRKPDDSFFITNYIKDFKNLLDKIEQSNKDS